MELIEIQLKSSFRCPSGRTWGRVLPVIGAKFACPADLDYCWLGTAGSCLVHVLQPIEPLMSILQRLCKPKGCFQGSLPDGVTKGVGFAEFERPPKADGWHSNKCVRYLARIISESVAGDETQQGRKVA